MPLTNRLEDIEPLAEHILERLMREQGFPRKRLSAGAVVALRQRAWPGNVRELQNVLERAAVFATGEEIGAAAIFEGSSQEPPGLRSQPVPIDEIDLPGVKIEVPGWPTLSE